MRCCEASALFTTSERQGCRSLALVAAPTQCTTAPCRRQVTTTSILRPARLYTYTKSQAQQISHTAPARGVVNVPAAWRAARSSSGRRMRASGSRASRAAATRARPALGRATHAANSSCAKPAACLRGVCAAGLQCGGSVGLKESSRCWGGFGAAGGSGHG